MLYGNTSHVLALPKWTLGLRIAQGVLALITLGLAGYALYYYPFDGIEITTFMGAATIIITLYVVLSTLVWPVAYNYWAVLGLDAFGTLIWLVSFALLASEVNSTKTLFDDYDYGGDLGSSSYSSSGSNDGGVTCATYDGYTDCVRKRALNLFRRDILNNYYSVNAAAAGVGALEFVLFAISLAFTGLYLHRHRGAGGHCTIARMNDAGNTSGYTGDKPEDLRPEAV